MNLGDKASKQQETLFKILTKNGGWHTTREILEEYIKATIREGSIRRSLHRLEEQGRIMRETLPNTQRPQSSTYIWRRVPNEP